jgi:hypothetical protein
MSDDLAANVKELTECRKQKVEGMLHRRPQLASPHAAFLIDTGTFMGKLA